MSNQPQDPSAAPRWLLIVFGLAALGLAGALLVYAYGRLGGDEAALPPSIPAYEGTVTAGGTAVFASDTLPEAGSPAPDFELPDVDDTIVRLSDYRGRPVILNFWATWCAPCRLEMPELERAQAEFGPDGPVVLTINQEESAEQVDAFFTEVGLTLPALLDSNGDVGAAYGAFFLPTTVIVGPDGIVAAVHRGLIDRDKLDGYLSQIAAGES